MKAIILAAGLGTRLKDLTKDLPKCLIKLNNKTLLENQIKILKKEGVKDILVVIGNEGACWNKENQESVKKITNNIIKNYKNTKTNNSYSLRLALEKIEEDDLLIIDGDLIILPSLLKKVINTKKSLIISKKSYKKNDLRNKIIINENGRILEMGKHITKEKLSLPYFIYGALIRIEKRDFNILKKIINKEKYYNLDLSFFINELCKNINLYKITDNRWVNINTKEELHEAKNLLLRKFLVLMFGYTAVGKSTIAKKISKIPNTNIFHSAVVRRNLNLTPKTKEEADKFFDYKNNLRKEVDKKVYGKLVENSEISLKKGKNVVLDAGYFFNWQRRYVYKKAVQLNAEIFVVKVICKDEEEIKKRIEKRENSFGTSPFNETPSWNTYIATKMITEPLEKDILPENIKLNIIEYDTLTREVKFIQGDKDSKNTQKIMLALKK